MKYILLLSVLSFIMISCGENDKETIYNSHNIILPHNIDLDSTIISIQLETDLIHKEYDKIQNELFIFPHPVISEFQASCEFKESIEIAEIKIKNVVNNISKIIYKGNLSMGGNSFNLNMNELFGDDYGFYKVQVVSENNVVYEKEFFYRRNHLDFQKDVDSPLYLNIRLLNLENVTNHKIKFQSDFVNYINKKIDRIAPNGQYLSTHKLINNVRISLIKPYEYFYGDYIDAGFLELYSITLSYDDLKKLKEIIFTESDKIEN